MMNDKRPCVFCVDAPEVDFDYCRACGRGKTGEPIPPPLPSILDAIRKVRGNYTGAEIERMILATHPAGCDCGKHGERPKGCQAMENWRCPDCGSPVTKVHVYAGGLAGCGKPPGYWSSFKRGEMETLALERALTSDRLGRRMPYGVTRWTGSTAELIEHGFRAGLAVSPDPRIVDVLERVVAKTNHFTETGIDWAITEPLEALLHDLRGEADE